MGFQPLPEYQYQYQHGPVSQKQALQENIQQGNCRLAVQIFYHHVFNIFLSQDQVLLPQAFMKTGQHIFPPFTSQQEINLTEIPWQKLKFGDILYAARWRNKKGHKIFRAVSAHENYEQWLINLHSAIYLGALQNLSQGISHNISAGFRNFFANLPFASDTNLIWHATAIENGTCFWSVVKFNEYYRLVAAKRLI